MRHTATRAAPPPSWLLWAESRAGLELGATLAAWPLLQFAPRGDGHAVLVIPGLIASDASTELLRAYLRGRGYAVHGWGLGPNFGPRSGVFEALHQRLEHLRASTGRPVSLVGWSLGGAFARGLAASRPDAVRNVISLGSPIVGNPRSSNAWRLYEALSGKAADDASVSEQMRAPVGVPTTSIYSRSDGVVGWRASHLPPAPGSENIEVYGSHLGLGVNSAVLLALADRLAQREGAWAPFSSRTTMLRALYPDPDRP